MFIKHRSLFVYTYRVFLSVLRCSEVSLPAGWPLCCCAALWIVFQARLQLVSFLLVLVIFCYPVLQCIMLLCHQHLTVNSFIASINFAWFTSVAPRLHLALILSLSLWLSIKTLSHAGGAIPWSTSQRLLFGLEDILSLRQEVSSVLQFRPCFLSPFFFLKRKSTGDEYINQNKINRLKPGI